MVGSRGNRPPTTNHAVNLKPESPDSESKIYIHWVLHFKNSNVESTFKRAESDHTF